MFIFGIRNVPDRAQALREILRTLRPEGRLAILELNEPRRGLFAGLARFYIHRVVPRLGALLSGAREYRYLQESIEAFPPPEEFGALLRDCGFEEVEHTPMTFGVVTLFVCRKPASSDTSATLGAAPASGGGR